MAQAATQRERERKRTALPAAADGAAGAAGAHSTSLLGVRVITYLFD